MHNKRWLQRAAGGSLCHPRRKTCRAPMINLRFDFRCNSVTQPPKSSSMVVYDARSIRTTPTTNNREVGQHQRPLTQIDCPRQSYKRYSDEASRAAKQDSVKPQPENAPQVRFGPHLSYLHVGGFGDASISHSGCRHGVPFRGGHT